MVGAFLDQISTFAHRPEDSKSKNEYWRNTLVQTVNLPDIEHIPMSIHSLEYSKQQQNEKGIASSSSSSQLILSSSSLLYPNGTVSLELKQQISKQMEHTVKDMTIDYDDIRMRDLELKEKRRLSRRISRRKKLLEKKS
mmetsp:Transcript_24871/g.30566  ORF Transcript_24871/g.30566 Transcript_24871/m.30566 type:complete len:139 (-) Transcript_24871:177-593(-)